MTGPSVPVSVSVDCPAKTNLTLRVGQARAEWGNRHALDTIYCAVSIYDTVTATRKAPGTGFSLDLSGTHLGDLAASAIKRNHNVKDYGHLIPGHGGILDRFDSMIFTAPAIYFAVLFLGLR